MWVVAGLWLLITVADPPRLAVKVSDSSKTVAKLVKQRCPRGPQGAPFLHEGLPWAGVPQAPLHPEPMGTPAGAFGSMMPMHLLLPSHPLASLGVRQEGPEGPPSPPAPSAGHGNYPK